MRLQCLLRVPALWAPRSAFPGRKWHMHSGPNQPLCGPITLPHSEHCLRSGGVGGFGIYVDILQPEHHENISWPKCQLSLQNGHGVSHRFIIFGYWLDRGGSNRMRGRMPGFVARADRADVLIKAGLHVAGRELPVTIHRYVRTRLQDPLPPYAANRRGRSAGNTGFPAKRCDD